MSTASDAKPQEAPADAAPSHSFLEQMRFLKPYWVAPDQKWKARLLLGGIVALTVAEIALTAGVAFGFQIALNALVAKQAAVFAWSGAATLGGMVASTFSSQGRQYMTSNLQQNWRGWLTRQFNDAWLKDKSYLRMQHSKKYAQNPDQRIAETIPNVANTTLSLGLGLFRSVVGVATFSVVLWSISPLMLGAAVVCAAGAHLATHWTGGSMRGIWRKLMDTEAKFRHALTRVRDNAKPIALAGIEPVENQVLRDEFNSLDSKRRDFFKVDYRTSLVWQLNDKAAMIVPIALSAPKFFAGTATLGGLELTRQAYGQFYSALSWFPQGYAQIASWSANTSQLMDFRDDLEESKAGIPTPVAPVPPPAPRPKIVGGMKP